MKFSISAQGIAFTLYYGMRVLVALAFFGFLFERDWEFAFYSALIFLAMVIPSMVKGTYRLYFPFELDLAIVSFIFFSLYLGNLNRFYEIFPWWDAMLHFLSGVLNGIVGFILVYILNATQGHKVQLSPSFIAMFSFTFALAVAVIWEIYEFTVDTFFGYNTQETGWPDTMGDLILATGAALLVGIISYAWMRRRLRVPFTPGLLGKLEKYQYRGKPSVESVAKSAKSV